MCSRIGAATEKTLSLVIVNNALERLVLGTWQVDVAVGGPLNVWTQVVYKATPVSVVMSG